MTLYPQESCIQFDKTTAIGVFVKTISGKLSREFDSVRDSTPSKGMWIREWDPILQKYGTEQKINYDRYDIGSIRQIDCFIPSSLVPETPTNSFWIIAAVIVIVLLYMTFRK